MKTAPFSVGAPRGALAPEYVRFPSQFARRITKIHNGSPTGDPSYNKHVPNIYFILVFGYACYRRCCGLVAAPYR